MNISLRKNEHTYRTHIGLLYKGSSTYYVITLGVGRGLPNDDQTMARGGRGYANDDVIFLADEFVE